MATTLTVIWNDCNCDGMGNHHVCEVALALPLAKVRELPSYDIVCMAMLRHYRKTHEETEAWALYLEAIKSYGLAGIIIGAVEWLH